MTSVSYFINTTAHIVFCKVTKNARRGRDVCGTHIAQMHLNNKYSLINEKFIIYRITDDQERFKKFVVFFTRARKTIRNHLYFIIIRYTS